MGGSARGRTLLGPKGFQFRPTTGQVKEFIFSYIGQNIEEAKILDLFAGTGSLGIEALSRGAKEVIFVERELQSLNILKKNLQMCKFWERAHIVRGDAFRILQKFERNGEVFDFILADPPFKDGLRGRILRGVGKSSLLNAQGLLILEHEAHDPDRGAHGLTLLKQRKFGHCVISIYT